MTYNNPGTHGMPDKVESGCPLYYAALGHSYAQNCLVAASFAIPPQLLDRSCTRYANRVHREKPPLPFSPNIPPEISLSDFFFSRFREKRRRRGCDTVVKDRMPPPPPSSSPPLLPRVTRGQMIYRRTVVAAYKTVIMFYHPGQSTETATEPAHETSGQPIRGHITNNEILLSYWKSRVGVLYRRLYIVER